MISIIVSSYNDQFFNSFSESVKETIGTTTYEIIKIDNPGLMCLGKAYNEGASKANFENLLFIHEDTLFRTINWGEKIIELNSSSTTGVIGVAGEDYSSYVPSYWFSSDLKKMHFIQKYPGQEPVLLNRINFKSDHENENIKSLDGVFLSCKKTIFEEFRFDESISGYHGYDMDFSLRVAEKYQNMVTSSITIEHQSSGQLSKKWLSSLLFVWKKNKNLFAGNYNRSIELQKFYKLIMMMKKYGFTKKEIICTTFKYLNPQKLGYKNALKILLRLRYI